jgi:flagellin-like protein
MMVSRKINFGFGSKKGISPLIATVLLIAFAVALGAVVMNWGRSYTDKITGDTEAQSDTTITCALDVNLKPTYINKIRKICFDSSANQITAILENTGKELTGVKIVAIGATSLVNYEQNQSIRKGDVVKFTLSYDEATNGTLEQLMFTPKLKIDGIAGDTLCPDGALAVENIEDC